MKLQGLSDYGVIAASMIGSAFCMAGYVANGIVYGSLVGLTGRESDMRTANFRSMTFLCAAIILQLSATFFAAAVLRRRYALGKAVGFASGLLFSVIGTILILVVFAQANHLLRFM